MSSQSSQTMLNAIVGSDAATVRGFANGYLVPGRSRARRPVRDARRQPSRPSSRRSSPREILRIEVRLADGTILLSDADDPAGSRGQSSPDFTGRGRRNGHGRVPPGRRCRVGRRGPARERHPARLLPGQGRRQGRRGRRDLARCGPDPRRPRSAPSPGHDRHAVRRGPGGRRPLPRLPGGPATHPAPDRRAARGDAARPADRHAESRRPGRACSPSRSRPRARPTRPSGSRSSTSTTSGTSTRPTAIRPATRRSSRSPRSFATCSRRRPTGGATDPTSSWSSSPPTRRPTWSRRSNSSGRGSSTSACNSRRPNACPITVSAGICAFPINGESVTTLLSSASRTLDEAKASGGDSVRVAEAGAVPLAEAVRFDVLEGLIIAVDTKDHYTRRHSEDVARYAGFLAAQLGLDDQAPLRRSTGPVASTTSARSASPTRSCASPAPSPRAEYEIGEAARRARRPHRPRPARPRRDPGRHPPPPRALGRQGLPAWAGRRRHPGGRPDPRGLRCVLRDDDDPAVPQGPVRRRGADPPRGRVWLATRRAPGHRLRQRHPDGRDGAHARGRAWRPVDAGPSRS